MEETLQKINLVGPKDLEISYFCGSGAGGQKRNKTASGVQIKHTESGAMGRASDTRSQDQNKRHAFERMLKTPQMKFWLARKLYEIHQGETIEESVQESLQAGSLKHEIKDESGKWVEVAPEYFDTEQAKSE